MNIHQAAAGGHVDAVRRHLDQGVSVNELNGDQQTPLMEAAAAGQEDVLRLLLNAGADPKRFNSIALDFAVRFGTLECVRMLLAAGADPNRSNLDDRLPSEEPSNAADGSEKTDPEELEEITNASDPPPILEAAHLGNPAMVELLLSAGARLDLEHGGYGLVAAALASDNETLAFELLARGASLGGALRIALERRKPILGEKLLDAGADVQDTGTDGMTPLMLAAYYGCDTLIPRLVASGSKLEQRDSWDKTALAYAVQERKPKAVRALLQAGASLANAEPGESQLVSTCNLGSKEIVQVLLDFGVDPNERNSQGRTPLLTAVEGKLPHIVKLLLERGANANAYFPADKKLAKRAGMIAETSPLIEAVKKKSERMVTMLLKAGADVHHADAAGRTAADLATRVGDPEILARIREAGGAINADPALIATNQLLRALKDKKATLALQALDAGADPNACDAINKSALTYAAQHGMVDMTERLLQAGARPNGASQWQESPLRHACLRHKAEVVRLLLNAGADVNARHSAASIPHDEHNTVYPSLETALHDAATYGVSEVLRMLIEAGADLNFVGESGVSPVMAAVNMRRMDSVQILLDPGALVRPEEACQFAAYRFAERAKSPAFEALVNTMRENLGDPLDHPMLPGAKLFQIRLPEGVELSVASWSDTKAARAWGERFTENYGKLDTLADQARERFMPQVREHGFLLVDAGKPVGCGPMMQMLVLLPTSDKFEAMFAFGIRGNDQELRTAEMVDWFRKLDAEEPFELRGLRFDTVDIVFAKPVSDPNRWAKEIAYFCHDLVGIDETAIRGLAKELRTERRVNFWWD